MSQRFRIAAGKCQFCPYPAAMVLQSHKGRWWRTLLRLPRKAAVVCAKHIPDGMDYVR